MDPLNAIKSTVVVPWGVQVKRTNSWYPQEICNEWPHQLSALSLGESSVVKFGVTYPLRTGLGTPTESDFPEYTSFFISPTLSADRPVKGVYEEAFVSRGICLLSEGPIGGPSFIKGFYRPELSYSTGLGIKHVVKAKFPSDACLENEDFISDNESFICLVEKGGISIFAENSSEAYVAYMPEFQIEKAVSCKYGLLVVPSTKGTTSETGEDRYLYVLTHPIKQVSKVGQRCNPVTDFVEYDTRTEKLLWCEGDICIFWSLKNDKFTLRRLHKLEKRNVTQGSTLNASMYYTTNQTQDQTNSPFTPAGGSSMYSPFLRSGHSKASAMRINREGGTVYYWPSFDFSETAHGFNAGFFPPHIGIYDEPELYFKLMFNIELNQRGKWKEPKRFQVVSSAVHDSRITLFYLIKNGLYVYCIDVESGDKVSHYVLKGVQDFVCSRDSGAQRVLVVLTVEGHIKMGWLDNDFNIAASARVNHDIDVPLRGVEYFFDYDTIICNLKDDCESKAVIKTKSYLNNSLITRCMNKFAERLPSKFVAKLTYKYVSSDDTPYFQSQWKSFTIVLHETLQSEKEAATPITEDTYHAIESLKEDMKLNSSSNELFRYLEELSQSILVYHKSPAQSLEPSALLQTFAKLLLKQDPKAHPEFESLPEVMQVLLEDPDSVANLERLVKVKTDTSSFIPVIDILLADVFQRNQGKVHFSWPESAISVTGRMDYLSGSNDPCSLVKDKVFEVFTPFREKEDSTHEPSWITHVLNMRVFSEDRRLEEVCRLLDSASPLIIDVEQRAEMSDHEFVEEQEKHLLQLIQITFAAPVGRAAFTLRTEQKNFANLTSGIYLPKLCLTGKCATKGTTIELNENDLPPSYIAWPNFHNAVASSLSVSFLNDPADAWFAHNKARMAEVSEQAGMILGFGLNGILSSMPPTLRHEYLAQENSFTTMSMLLGLCANLAGTGDIATWKVVSLHIGAMLPACTTELEIPRLATLVAPFALGLLFIGTHNSHVAKVLLGEISKKYSPLSIFGGGNGNSSSANVNQSENSHSAADREAHSLCSGFGLGFVNLGKGRDGSSCLGEDGFDGILRRFVVGGPKPASSNNGAGDDEDVYSQYGQSMPSLWEEYRCCHIEEGDNVNVDVTTPSAIIAVALTYLRSGNEAVIKWLSPPNTLHLLDGVRPDVLMLRSLASILVYETIEDPRKEWLEYHLMADALSKSFSLKSDNLDLRIDRESIVQAWASIICGYCLGLGIRYAGTSEHTVINTLWCYTNEFLKLASLDSRRKVRRLPKNISEYFPKNFLESCVCTLMMAVSLVNAGTENVKALRLCRFMQSKIAATQITSSSNTYGMEMCIAMASGILFLGGGRYSLSNDDRSIAVLLAAVFPKWPINANDNRYHLQALRHLYVLAAQPRLMLPRPMPHNAKLKFKIEFLDGRKIDSRAPILLPPLHLLKRISLNDRNFLSITFDLPGDLQHLKEIVEGGGVLNLVPKPVGHLKQNFIPKMSWREKHALHPTFEINPSIPTEEYNEIKEINCISRIAESSGLTHIIPSLVALRNGDPKREDWMWQLRVLYIWVTMNVGKTPSLLRMDLLALLLNKASIDFKLFSPLLQE